MSYLATLARPAVAAAAVVPARVPAPAAETFGEVHQEIDVFPPGVAPARKASRDDRLVEAEHAAPRDARPTLEQPIAVDSSARPRPPPATGDERGIEAAQVAEPHPVARASARRPEPAIDVASARKAPSPAPPLAADAPLDAADLADLRAPMRPAPMAREATRAQHPEREDDPANDHPADGPRRVAPLPRVAPVDREGKPAALRAAPSPTRRDKVSIHIGAISLTVKAPSVSAAPVAAPPAQALPAAAPLRSREGLGFSASRHYLRWS